MRIRFQLDNNRIKQLLSFSGDYVEVALVDRVLLMFSEEENNYVQTAFETLSVDGGLEQIRIPVSVFKDLRSEIFMDIVIKTGEVEFSFFGDLSKHLYTITLEKQKGVIDYSNFVELRSRSASYECFDFSESSSMISVLSRLRADVFCVDKVMYGEFMKGYIFKKCNIPNFGIPSANLVKLMGLSTRIFFLGGYLFAEKESVEVFMFRHRVPKSCDLLQCRKQRFTHDITIDTTAIKQVFTRLSIDSNSSIVLDCGKSKMTVTDTGRKIEVDVPVSDVKSIKLDNSEEELLNSLSMGSDEILEVSDLNNPHGIKPIGIPKWVLTNILRFKQVKVLISRSFVMISLLGYKIIYPGGVR